MDCSVLVCDSDTARMEGVVSQERCELPQERKEVNLGLVTFEKQ